MNLTSLLLLQNIAPVPIEDTLKSELPGISNVMMVGDKRKYNVCLVTLNTKMDEETGTFTNELVGNSLGVNGSSAKTTQVYIGSTFEC